MATPGLAASAYARLARITDPSAGLSKTIGDANGKSDGPSFGALLKDALGAVQDAGRKSDAQTQMLVAGNKKANMVDVVTAVAETETAVQALVSVRDKVIAAYEEIMRMQI
jgi:flagellar hook-basal body complex protein FliE